MAEGIYGICKYTAINRQIIPPYKNGALSYMKRESKQSSVYLIE